MAASRRLVIAALLLLLLFIVVIPAAVAYSSIHPERCNTGKNPASFGLDYDNFTVYTRDNVYIRGWAIDASGDDAVFIIMHGYTSCKADERLLKLASLLVEDGYDVVMFDFRGHGESGGSFTSIGPLEVYDAEAVIDYTASMFPSEDIVLVGYSMGGAVAIVVGASDERVSAVVADSPYYTLSDVIPRWIEHTTPLPGAYGGLIGFYGSIMTGQSLDFGPANVDSLDKPLIVFYGTEDPLLTLDEAKSIAGKSPCGKLVVGDGAGHVEVYKVLGLEDYVDIIEGYDDLGC